MVLKCKTRKSREAVASLALLSGTEFSTVYRVQVQVQGTSPGYGPRVQAQGTSQAQRTHKPSTSSATK